MVAHWSYSDLYEEQRSRYGSVQEEHAPDQVKLCVLIGSYSVSMLPDFVSYSVSMLRDFVFLLPTVHTAGSWEVCSELANKNMH